MRIPRINNELFYADLSYKIYGLFFGIHNKLGRYKNEQQYADAFENSLKIENIGYVREKSLPPSFRGEKERRCIPDFIIEDKIIVDLKSKDFILKEDYFQMQRY